MAPIRFCWQSADAAGRVLMPHTGSRGGNGMSATEEAVRPKTVADVLETDEAKALLDAGREAGQLSADEIASGLDELDLEPGQIDDLPRSRGAPYRGRGGRSGGGRAGPRGASSRGLDRRAAALPEGHRQGRPAHRRAGGRAREADRARRPWREAGDGRGEPAPRRLDRKEVPKSGLAVPRSDPGGDDRARAGSGEVRLPQGLQVLDLRDVVDPPGGRARAGRQGAHNPHAGARRREA